MEGVSREIGGICPAGGAHALVKSGRHAAPLGGKRAKLMAGEGGRAWRLLHSGRRYVARGEGGSGPARSEGEGRDFHRDGLAGGGQAGGERAGPFK